jgi:hypothetical protein
LARDPNCQGCASTVPLGPSWGPCSERPRLPGRGFTYDADEMRAVTALFPTELLTTYPGCGSVPLVLRANRARQNGGGVYKSSCDVKLEDKVSTDHAGPGTSGVCQ